MSRRRLAALIAAAALICPATACATAPTGAPNAAEPLDAFTVSDTIARATVVGIGEATHDGRQTTQLRLAVLRQLVEKHGFRAFALESGFGGATKVEAYVQGGRGTAEEAVKGLYRIYRNRQMVELVEWMRTHNAAAAPQDRVHFIGVDPRDCGSTSAIVVSYLETADPQRAAAVRSLMSGCTDATEVELPTADHQRIAAGMTEHVAWFDAHTEADPGRAGDLGRARIAAHSLRDAAQIRAAGIGVQAQRDRFLAEYTERVAIETGHGVVFAAHNGHVDKGGAAFSHPGAGKLLHQRLGDAYRTIGTDFSTADVWSDGSRQATRITVRRLSGLRGLVHGSGYVDLARAAQDPGNAQLLGGSVRMGAIGTPFASWQGWFEVTRTVAQVPARDFDAIAVFDHLEATERL